jgi:hypothetical protein
MTAPTPSTQAWSTARRPRKRGIKVLAVSVHYAVAPPAREVNQYTFLTTHKHMTIVELQALLIKEVNYGITLVKQRGLYKQASFDVKKRIEENIEEQIVHLVLSTRYFNEDIAKRDLGIPDQTVNEMISNAMVKNFSIFGAND